MKELIIGSGGQQPFGIKQSGVSNHHAKLTIDDQGQWILEDLNSTNGTFVRDDNGDMRRISKSAITPMTFICLGPDNANGCSFYAKQLEKQSNFTEEFLYIQKIVENFSQKMEKIDRKSELIRKSVAVVSIIAFFMSFTLEPSKAITAMRFSSAFSALVSLLFNMNKAKKAVQSKREKYLSCPNPHCSNKLSTKDVQNMQCPKCKAH